MSETIILLGPRADFFETGTTASTGSNWWWFATINENGGIFPLTMKDGRFAPKFPNEELAQAWIMEGSNNV